MAPDLRTGFGMGMEMGMTPLDMMTMEPPPPTISGAYMCGLPAGDTMRVDDLLDFGKDDLFDAASAVADSNHNGHLPVHEDSGAAGSSEASSYLLSAFKDDFHIPSEEAAELEWLSSFVDDSFSDDVLPVVDRTSFKDCAGAGLERATLSSNYNALTTDQYSAIPARARSKRSRAPATALHSNTAVTWSSPTSSSSEAPPPIQGTPSKHSANAGCSSRKKEAAAAGGGPTSTEGRVRRCAHCASEKTPQWRTGPLGPKTLCNACGVRYKSGRLVPEYRPAASPTFVLTQHSNSHRKVMELRRHKELLFLRHQVTGGGGDCPAASVSLFPRAPDAALFCNYEAS